MGKIILLFGIPCLFLAIGAYWLYFSGWKRGIVQGERVTKAYLSKKIKKILKNEAKIKKSQAELKLVYLTFDLKIKDLEVKKGLKVEEVKNIRVDLSNLETGYPHAHGYIGGVSGMDQEPLMRQQLTEQYYSSLHYLWKSLFTRGLPKPPWK